MALIYRPLTTETEKKPSVFGGALKILDYIERPYYGLMNMGKDLIGGEEGFHPLKSAWAGLSGQDKVNFSDILTEGGWKPTTTLGKIAKGAVGFAGGVALDPLTYLGSGAMKGAMFLAGGMKALAPVGKELFFKEISKEIGIKMTNKRFIKAVQTISLKSPEVYEKVMKKVLTIAEQEPEKYFAKTMLKFAGQDVADISKFSSSIRNMLGPVSKTPIVARNVGKGGAIGKRVLGDIFIPHYSIMESKNLTMADKFTLIKKAENLRIQKEIATADRIRESMGLLKKFPDEQKKQITYKIEEMLGKFDEELGKKIKYYTPEGLEVLGKTKKEYLNSIFQDLKRDILDSIKDKNLRNATETIIKKMEDIGLEEVVAKIRKKGSLVAGGYLKRLTTGVLPKESLFGSKMAREKGAQTVAQSEQAYKAGEQLWKHEANPMKWLPARLVEHDTMMMKKEFMDKMIEQGYIAPVRKGGVNEGMATFNYLGKNYQTFPEIAKEFSLYNKQTSREGWKGFMNFYDGVTDIWKTSVTSLFPSFHFRNFVSNLYLAYLGGVKNIEMYRLATKVQWYGRQMRNGLNPKDEIIKLGGQEWRMSELYNLSSNQGILGSGWYGRDIVDKVATAPTGIINKFKNISDTINWASGKVRKVGTAVENNARLGMFFDQLAKGKTAQESSFLTKKFLFDYGELTDTEREKFKRVIPFYTWLRKNIPLQMEQMIKQPGKYTGIIHAKEGIESMSPDVEEKLLPSWMRSEEMMIRFPGNKYWSPDLPFQDLANVFSIKKWVSATSPLVKGFFELTANKDFFTGKPLADQNLPTSKFKREEIKNWLLNQMRYTSYWRRASNEDRSAFEFYIDFLFGIKTYPFDVRQGQKSYLQQKSLERTALLKFQKTKEKAAELSAKARKKLIFMK